MYVSDSNSKQAARPSASAPQMMGLGIKGYFRFPWNRFDFIVVAFSTFEEVMNLASLGFDSFLTVLRTFRLLRVLKLAQNWWELGVGRLAAGRH